MFVLLKGEGQVVVGNSLSNKASKQHHLRKEANTTLCVRSLFLDGIENGQTEALGSKSSRFDGKAKVFVESVAAHG